MNSYEKSINRFEKSVNRVIRAAKNMNEKSVLNFVKELKSSVVMDCNLTAKSNDIRLDNTDDLIISKEIFKISKKYRRLLGRLIWLGQDVVFDSYYKS